MSFNQSRKLSSVDEWNRLLHTASRHPRRGLAGGKAHLRKWFSYTGSMTQQLRTTGKIQLSVNWFSARSEHGIARAPRMHIRHAQLRTPKMAIEAWVWLPQSAHFREKYWFRNPNQPIGDILFRSRQKRYFRFFKYPGDYHRSFRYSRLKSPGGTTIQIIEALVYL